MTHYRRSRRRPLKLVLLLAMASASSALSLANLQLIVSNEISKSCIRAYKADIQGCSLDDFTNKQCSSSCAKGLQDEETRVKASCRGLQVSSNSLLGITLAGKLVDTLCPGFQATTVTQTISPSTTRGFSTIPTSTTTSVKTTPTSKPSDTLPDTTLASDTTTAIQPSPTSVAQETSTSPATSATSDATSVQSTAQSTVSQLPTQSPPPDDPESDDSSSDDSQQLAPGSSNSGSPFDGVPVISLGESLCSAQGTEKLLAAVLIAIFLIH
ncbi:hypothetical protein F4779DRAFT_300962 [Xylariaceae sp. FL0662B]|nr:hypothetical protein F4779DRAFT_300962 [Xylariaceae sp. FL0662B]